MIDKQRSEILAAVDECVETYIEQRRSQIKSFVADHFSVQETLQIQKKSAVADLIYNPFNAVWAIPYFFVRKSSETFDKLGWFVPLVYLNKVPQGIKTHYQKHIEKLVFQELLGWSDENLFLKEVSKNKELSAYLKNSPGCADRLTEVIKVEVEQFSSGQALIADLSGSVITLVTGWLAFGDKSLGVLGLGERIAGKLARSKASSHFFLGEKAGAAFYAAFPPRPSGWQILGATLLVGFFLTLFSFVSGLLWDPFRKKLGLYELKLNLLMDRLEDRLFLELKKEIKRDDISHEPKTFKKTSPR